MSVGSFESSLGPVAGLGSDLGRRAVLTAGLALGSVSVLQGVSASPAHAAGPEQLIGPARGDDLHVMTYNIRYPSSDDHGPRSWTRRRPQIAALLDVEQPTIIGIQEGYFFQLQEVLADLGPSYDWIHLFREGGSNSEACAIIYDKQRLKPVAYDHLWLSDEPRLIGSATWGNELTRMLTWVRFLDLRTSAQFVCLNTHFDHQSENARAQSARMLLKVTADFDVPTVFVGDFNAAHDTSDPYRILVNDGGLSDTWVDADEQLTDAYATFNGWNRPELNGDRIDWILNTEGIRALKVAINTWTENGNNPSDHWPVQALFRLT